LSFFEKNIRWRAGYALTELRNLSSYQKILSLSPFPTFLWKFSGRAFLFFKNRGPRSRRRAVRLKNMNPLFSQTDSMPFCEKNPLQGVLLREATEKKTKIIWLWPTVSCIVSSATAAGMVRISFFFLSRTSLLTKTTFVVLIFCAKKKPVSELEMNNLSKFVHQSFGLVFTFRELMDW
jgi:hypothetical protein